MNLRTGLNIEPGKAICYSGFREGQEPGGIVPSYDEIKEDLLMLHNHWKYLRLYDCDEHSDIVLEVILKEKLNFFNVFVEDNNSYEILNAVKEIESSYNLDEVESTEYQEEIKSFIKSSSYSFNSRANYSNSFIQDYQKEYFRND